MQDVEDQMFTGGPGEQSAEGRYLRAVESVAGVVSSGHSISETLTLALSRAVQATGATSGSIYLPADDGYWKLAVSQGVPESLAAVHSLLPPSNSALQTILASKETVYFTQKVEDRPGPIPDESRAFGTQSWASVAIYDQDKVCGVLAVSSKVYNAFGPGELRVLRVIGQLLSLALCGAPARERALPRETGGRHNIAELEAILGSIADGVLITDVQGKIIKANRASSRILGLREEEIEGHSLEQARLEGFQRPPGEEQPEDLNYNPVADILSGRSETARFNVEMKVGDRSRAFSATASAIHREGRREGLVVVFRDVTRERDIERKKEEFLRLLSHELRGPLTVIGAASQMISRSLAKHQLDSEARRVQIIDEQVNRMAGMVGDLVESSRLESGEQALSEEPTDPGALVRNVIQRIKVERQQLETSHPISVKVQPGLPSVMLDKRRIDQVLTNLLANAMRYSPNGGEINVTVGTEGEPPEWLRVTVTDEGIGVPDEEKSRVFEQAFRGKGGRAISQSGLGLGLYICRLAVEAHGGLIGVQDAPTGQGSTFWFKLPLTGS